MSKKKKEKPIIARRRRISPDTYSERTAEREATRVAEMNLLVELICANNAAFARIAGAMERIAASLESPKILASTCASQPKTRKKVKPNA